MKKVLTIAVLFLVLIFAAWKVSRARTFQLFGEIVPRVETSRKVVALTFDDGPTREHTPEILELLAAKHVRATFFLIGRDIEQSPESAKQIVAAGHEVGNHSYSHQRMVMKSPEFIRREIESTDALLRAAGWRGPIHVRSPYCKKLVGVPWYLHRHHRTQITWDVEPESDPAIDRDGAKIAEFVLANVKPGSIVLLHPMYRNRGETRKALPRIIDGLRERGYDFITVNEMLHLNVTPSVSVGSGRVVAFRTLTAAQTPRTARGDRP